MAAGATIGSNHNSRSPDGEIQAGRGFWPGLCVSLKHNSKFASFTILAKGDYPVELNIPIPFSLVSNDVANDRLLVMPGYWFQYNMYALARNSWKYVARDHRITKKQLIEFGFLAPDTINEIITSITLLQKLTGKAYLKSTNDTARPGEEEIIRIGKNLLEANDPIVNELEIVSHEFENSSRKAVLIKVQNAYNQFKELITYNAVQQMIPFLADNSVKTIAQFQAQLPVKTSLSSWMNIGGQLILRSAIDKLLIQIVSNKVKTWDDVHSFYASNADQYPLEKLKHAAAALKEVHGISLKKANITTINNLLQQSITTKEWMVKGIHDSRAKDYTNAFRKMAFNNIDEMNAVTGKLNDNSFIKQELAALASYKKTIQQLVKKLG